MISVACGMVSQYNLKPEERYGLKNLYNVVTKRLRMRGFIVGDKDIGPKWIKERNEKVTAVSDSSSPERRIPADERVVVARGQYQCQGGYHGWH